MDTIYNAEGCFYRALDDEPVFVILARDPCAAETVRWWVTLRQALIGRGEKPLEDHEKLADALSTAQAMTVWRSDATGPEWIDGPRWKVEEVPTRELVDCAEIARLQDRVRELEEIISTAQHQTVDAIKTCLDITSLVDLPPEEGRPDAILRKRLENYEDDHRVTISAGALRKVIRATPFVAVDLAAKVAMGLRQITTEYLATVAATTIWTIRSSRPWIRRTTASQRAMTAEMRAEHASCWNGHPAWRSRRPVRYCMTRTATCWIRVADSITK